jgi:hypothetical protein
MLGLFHADYFRPDHGNKSRLARKRRAGGSPGDRRAGTPADGVDTADEILGSRAAFKLQ